MKSRYLPGIEVLAVLVFVGCSQEKMQESVQSAQQSTAQATEEVKQAAEETTKAVGDAAADVQKAAGDATDAAKGAASKAAEAVDAAGITKEFGDLFASITKTLSSVTDAASAPAAASELEKTGISVKDLVAKFSSLPAPVKSAVTEFVSKGLEGLKPLVEKVLAIPGVGDSLKPHVDGIMSQLDQVTKPKAE